MAPNDPARSPTSPATWVQTQRASRLEALPGLGRSAVALRVTRAFDHHDLVDQCGREAHRASRQPAGPRAAATGFGLAKGSTLFLDVESYDNPSPAAINRSSTTCLAGTRACRALGWKGGLYSSPRPGSGPRQHPDERPRCLRTARLCLDRSGRREGQRRARNTCAAATTGTSG